MKHLIFNILIFSFTPLLLAAMPLAHHIQNPDTIPPPPPAQALILSGPSEACVGETSTYITEVPVACTCLWAINGVFQPATGPEFTYTWTEPGLQLLTLEFVCGGQATEPDTLPVTVWQAPEVFLGNDTTILQGQSLLLDAGNPGSNYFWSTGATTQTILVSTAGSYAVTVSNPCGVDTDEILVSVIVGSPENDPENVIIRSAIGKLILDNLPHDIKSIQVMDYTGRIIYNGKPRKELRLTLRGVVLVRFIGRDSIPVLKVIIP